MNSKPLQHQTIGIVGAGLLGRLLAFSFRRQGAQVTLFDRDDRRGARSCGYTGAGMLAPVSELESAEPTIARLGFASLPLWEVLVSQLENPVFFSRLGTLIVAHHLDMPDLQRFARMLQGKLAGLSENEWLGDLEKNIHWQLSRLELMALEPQLGEQFQQGLYIPDEGQIDNRQLMIALEQGILTQAVEWRCNTEVRDIQPHQVGDGFSTWQFDWVIDCRGLGARPDWDRVRGVRGEIIRVHAPEVSMSRPIRLMHPRYPLYITPRENHHYLIGATAIESEDLRPMTMRSALELLSAAYAVHSGFAEASILEMSVNCRPALPDNMPQIQVEDGLIRINGLYRHGFLISPKLVELVGDYLADQTIPSEYSNLFLYTHMEEAAYATAN
jgi:glycine oxidase